MNKYFEINLALKEIKIHYQIQGDSMSSLMRSARGILTTTGFIISIIGVFKLIEIRPDFKSLNFNNLLLLTLVFIFFYILYKCVKILSPKEIFTPIKISSEKLNSLFIVESEKEAKEKILKLYYAAFIENRKTIEKLKEEINKVNNAFALFLVIVFIMVFL